MTPERFRQQTLDELIAMKNERIEKIAIQINKHDLEHILNKSKELAYRNQQEPINHIANLVRSMKNIPLQSSTFDETKY